jgi:hypothetical protein
MIGKPSAKCVYGAKMSTNAVPAISLLLKLDSNGRKISPCRAALHPGEDLRLNKECFDHALLLAGLLPVAKSDNAEFASQQTQTGCGQNLRLRRYSALQATRPLEHNAELGIMFYCFSTPHFIRRQMLTAPAGVVWLTERRLFFALCPKW